jgi:hypothetical protein
LRDHVGIIREIEVLCGALGDAPTLYQADLGGDESRCADVRPLLLLIAILTVGHVERGRVSFERYRCTIDGARQQGDDYRAGEPNADCAEDEPAPMVDDPDEAGEIENARG